MRCFPGLIPKRGNPRQKSAAGERLVFQDSKLAIRSSNTPAVCSNNSERSRGGESMIAISRVTSSIKPAHRRVKRFDAAAARTRKHTSPADARGNAQR